MKMHAEDCPKLACPAVMDAIRYCTCATACERVSLKLTQLHEWACTCGCAGSVFLLLRADLRS